MTKKPTTGRSDRATVEAILERAIAAAGASEGRISTAEMVELVGVRSAKGVGSKLRRLFEDCLVSERIAVSDALRIRGSGASRGWEAGPKSERALAQYRAAKRLTGEVPALDLAPAHDDAADAAERGWMTVRVLRERWFWTLFTDGVPALRDAIDTMSESVEEPTERGEIFVAEMRRVAGGEVETRVQEAFCFGGARTRGRHDLQDAPTIDAYHDGAIRACIVHGQWWERETRADDIAAVLETLDHFMIDWSEWRAAEGLPQQRHVTAIVTEEDGHEWLPPPDLRMRKRLRVLFFNEDDEEAAVEVEAIRGQENHVLEQWIEDKIETEGGWHDAEPFEVRYAADGIHPDPMEGHPLSGHGPHEPVALRGWTGEWSFRGPGRSVLNEAADRYAENGNWYRATEVLRELTTIEGWNLTAAEGLAVSIDGPGTSLEREGIVRGIADRGLAALERAGFRWNRDRLDWYDIDNRPFLRSYYQVARMKERQGQTKEALRIYRWIERVTRPNDPLGARYEVARLLTLASDWKALARQCARMGEDAATEAVIARWIAAEMTGEVDAAETRMEEAMHACPLAVSRVIRGGGHTPRDGRDGYVVGGFDEANRHWNRYRAFYESGAGCTLRERLATRFHARRESEGAPHRWRRRNPAAEGNMTDYRRKLMALASINAEIRNEFWDLMSQIESGSQRAEIEVVDETVSITRHETDGMIMQIELLGDWKARMVETTPHGEIVMHATMHFEQAVDEIRARERVRARNG
ncbi:MAG: hypothetical protein OXC29_07540 [Rhodococcus sp.]|nr:hypothetical protein [Rhodococcus sp. (in: high G+C Gram-positive bacteria)]